MVLFCLCRACLDVELISQIDIFDEEMLFELRTELLVAGMRSLVLFADFGTTENCQYVRLDFFWDLSGVGVFFRSERY